MTHTRPIRVLIVDDVAIVRRLVTEALASDPALEIVGSAPNGRIALEKIPTLNPDVIILDYEMPEMDGLATLFEVKRSFPDIRVIIFSSYTHHGAKIALEALWRGADDFATKWSAASIGEMTGCVQSELIPKIKAVAANRIGPTPSWVSGTSKFGGVDPPTVPIPRAGILAIGASTGGPRALSVMLEALPAVFPIPIVIVQHMSSLFTKSLAERLAATTPHACEEGRDGAPVVAGTAWIAPGDRHMTVERVGPEVRLRLSSGPHENSCRPSVDPLFRSVAATYGTGALAVLLSGMGKDGLEGCRRVKEQRGAVLVQDHTSSVVWGMPGAVARAGLADRVLAIDEIAPEILRRTRSSQPVRAGEVRR